MNDGDNVCVWLQKKQVQWWTWLRWIEPLSQIPEANNPLYTPCFEAHRSSRGGDYRLAHTEGCLLLANLIVILWT